MALLVLLAAAAPARVVAPDLLLLRQAPRLDLDGSLEILLGHAIGQLARGRRGERARLLVAAARVGVAAGRRARRAAADRPGAGLGTLLLSRPAATAAVLALDLDLDVEDEARELLPDRVDQAL